MECDFGLTNFALDLEVDGSCGMNLDRSISTVAR